MTLEELEKAVRAKAKEMNIHLDKVMNLGAPNNIEIGKPKRDSRLTPPDPKIKAEVAGMSACGRFKMTLDEANMYDDVQFERELRLRLETANEEAGRPMYVGSNNAGSRLF